MNTRSQIKKGERDIMEGDPKIGSKIWLKQQRELVAMSSEGGANVEKKLANLTIMFQKISLQYQYFQEK